MNFIIIIKGNEIAAETMIRVLLNLCYKLGRSDILIILSLLSKGMIKFLHSLGLAILKCCFCRSQWKPRQDDGSKKGMQDGKVSPPCAAVPSVKQETTSAVV